MDKSNNEVDPKFGEDIGEAYDQFSETVEHISEDMGLALEELGEVVKVTGRSLVEETGRVKDDIWNSICRFQDDCASNKGVLIFGAFLGAVICVGIAYGLYQARTDEEHEERDDSTD